MCMGAAQLAKWSQKGGFEQGKSTHAVDLVQEATGTMGTWCCSSVGSSECARAPKKLVLGWQGWAQPEGNGQVPAVKVSCSGAM